MGAAALGTGGRGMAGGKHHPHRDKNPKAGSVPHVWVVLLTTSGPCRVLLGGGGGSWNPKICTKNSQINNSFCKSSFPFAKFHFLL